MAHPYADKMQGGARAKAVCKAGGGSVKEEGAFNTQDKAKMGLYDAYPGGRTHAAGPRRLTKDNMFSEPDVPTDFGESTEVKTVRDRMKKTRGEE